MNYQTSCDINFEGISANLKEKFIDLEKKANKIYENDHGSKAGIPRCR